VAAVRDLLRDGPKPARIINRALTELGARERQIIAAHRVLQTEPVRLHGHLHPSHHAGFKLPGENDVIEIVVPGEPRPKGRPRLGAHGNVYTPAATRAHEELVAWTVKGRLRQPLAGPLALKVCFFRSTERRVDIDNLLKALMDGANGIAWADDSQVVDVSASRAIDRAHPRTEIEITQL
jgi:crossover junction endodeoxyribonuclease RusA